MKLLMIQACCDVAACKLSLFVLLSCSDRRRRSYSNDTPSLCHLCMLPVLWVSYNVGQLRNYVFYPWLNLNLSVHGSMYVLHINLSVWLNLKLFLVGFIYSSTYPAIFIKRFRVYQ